MHSTASLCTRKVRSYNRDSNQKGGKVRLPNSDSNIEVAYLCHILYPKPCSRIASDGLLSRFTNLMDLDEINSLKSKSKKTKKQTNEETEGATDISYIHRSKAKKLV